MCSLLSNVYKSNVVSIVETSKFKSNTYFLKFIYSTLAEYILIIFGCIWVIVNGEGGTMTTWDSVLWFSLELSVDLYVAILSIMFRDFIKI